MERLVQRTLVAAIAAASLGGAFAQGVSEDAATIAARKKIFGLENVDDKGRLPRDKVLFSWLGHNTGAVSLRGRVVTGASGGA